MECVAGGLSGGGAGLAHRLGPIPRRRSSRAAPLLSYPACAAFLQATCHRGRRRRRHPRRRRRRRRRHRHHRRAFASHGQSRRRSGRRRARLWIRRKMLGLRSAATRVGCGDVTGPLFGQGRFERAGRACVLVVLVLEVLGVIQVPVTTEAGRLARGSPDGRR